MESVILEFLLIVNGVLHVLKSLSDDFLIISLGSKDTGDVDHCDVAGAFETGRLDEVVFLNVFGGGIQSGLQIAFHEAQCHAGARLDILANFFTKFLQFLDQSLGFIGDAGLVQLLNADINLEFFGGIGGDNLVVGLGGLHGAIHVFTLYLGQFFEAVGQFTENLLLLPFEVNGVEVGDDVLLTVKGYQSAVAGFGFLQQVGLIQLHDDLGDLLFCELIEHAAKALESIDIVSFQAVIVVFGN